MTGCAKVGTLLLVVLASCDSGECTHVFCNSGGVLEVASVAEADFARLPGATVNACFNGACSQGVIDTLPIPGESNSISLGTSTDPSISLALERFDPDTMVSVSLDVQSTELDMFQDGDVYTLDITGTDGTQLVHGSWSVGYQIDEPNGAACGPTCRVASTMTQL
jgi:hypothetical protein